MDIAEKMSDISGLSSDEDDKPDLEKYLEILQRNIMANDLRFDSPKLNRDFEQDRAFKSP